MKVGSRYRRSRHVQLGALVLAFQFASFALAAPMLVLCQDGSDHKAVESAIALCCSAGKAQSSDVTHRQTSARAADSGCAVSCIDTPLLTGTDAIAPKSVEPVSVAVALVPPVTPAPCPARVFSGEDAEFVTAVSSPHLSRSTVLRI